MTPLLIFIIIFILFYGSLKINQQFVYNNNKELYLILSALLSSAILVLILHYANLKENFHFELSPYKRCQGGPYMYSSDPELKAFCDSIPQEQLNQAFCNNGVNGGKGGWDRKSHGFIGMPVHFEYTPMSDDKWENHMCDDQLTNNATPQVL
jgi:hypothetical protein|uniref:Uncharacterized protein n=1 Tax=viral metagenome TaxID=1070528 RepID=A0A6C0D0U1_9ZZZZ